MLLKQDGFGPRLVYQRRLSILRLSILFDTCHRSGLCIPQYFQPLRSLTVYLSDLPDEEPSFFDMLHGFPLDILHVPKTEEAEIGSDNREKRQEHRGRHHGYS